MIPTLTQRKELPLGLRRALALAEILGGVALSALTIWIHFKGHGLAAWYVLMAQGLSVGFLAAGWMLWLGEPRGFSLSLPLQAAQILTLYTPSFAWALVAGPHFTVYWSLRGLSGELGINGTFTILFGRLQGWSFGVNLVALGATLLLLSGLRGAKERDHELEDTSPVERKGERVAPGSTGAP